MSSTNSFDDFKRFLINHTKKETIDDFDVKDDDPKRLCDRIAKIIENVEECYSIETLDNTVENYLDDINMPQRARQYFNAEDFIHALMNEDDYKVYYYNNNTFEETDCVTGHIWINTEGVVLCNDGNYIVKDLS